MSVADNVSEYSHKTYTIYNMYELDDENTACCDPKYCTVLG